MIQVNKKSFTMTKSNKIFAVFSIKFIKDKIIEIMFLIIYSYIKYIFRNTGHWHDG